jgi:predicted Zn finger-like uncharacterized protein
MILSCPSCNARFLVNAAALRPDGREVRCGRCRHQWFATPPDEPPAEAAPVPDAGFTDEPPLSPEPGPPIEPRPIPPGSNLPVLARKRRRPIAAAIGWALLGLVLVGLGVAVMERDRIMAMFPESRAVYEGLGFSVPDISASLKIGDITSSRTMQEGVPVLVIEARITNVTGYDQRVPRLRGVLSDAAGRELQAWTFAVSTPTLAPGESTPFRTEVRQPAAAATELRLVFISGE